MILSLFQQSFGMSVAATLKHDLWKYACEMNVGNKNVHKCSLWKHHKSVSELSGVWLKAIKKRPPN